MQTVFAKREEKNVIMQSLSAYSVRIGALVLGFVISGASIMSAIAPFGVSWVAAVPEKCTIFALTGSILGYLLLSDPTCSIRYVSALIILAALKWGFSFLEKKGMKVALTVFAGASLAISGFAATIPGTATDYLLVICESVVGVTSAMLFSKGYGVINDGQAVDGSRLFCMGIVLTIGVMGLSKIVFMGISPAGILACWALFIAGFYGNMGMGAITAAALGLAFFLGGEQFMLAPLIACGICVPVFAQMGKIAAVGTMLFIYAISLVGYGQEAMLGAKVIEILTGAGIFLLTPQERVRDWGIVPYDGAINGELLRKTVSARLNFIWSALDNIADVTVNVSKELDRMRSDPLEKFVSSAIDTACKKCIDSPRCWQTGYSTTKDGVNKAFLEVRSGAKLTENDIPPEILCRRPQALAQAVNDYGERYVAMCNSKKHSIQLRNIAGDQFSGMSMLIKDMEREISALSAMADKENRAVGKYFEALGILENDVCCALDINGRADISAAFSKKALSKLDLAKVTVELSEACMQELTTPLLFEEGDMVKIRWRPKAVYKLECAFLQRAARAAKLCGDSVEYISDGVGRAIMLLSDGMGIGGAAAVDSALTTSLLSKLLKSEVSFPAALRLVNCSLLSCGEERLCTIDAGIMDLYSGRLEIYKAGAAASFVLRKGRAAKIENSALPAGILGGAEAKKTVVNLNVGDIIVMMSDGITDGGDEWIPSQLASLAVKPLDEICQGIMETAISRRIEGREDDMSIMVGIVKKDW